MRLSSLPQYKRDGIRFVEITSTLVRYGFAERLHKLEPEFVRPWLKHEDVAELATLPFGQRVRRALEELGPTFIKLGQILSTRPDIIPPSVSDELAKLRADTPADPFSEVQALVEEELGAPLASSFASFDEEPLASASIGQVHLARLKSGREVVVKVQHPGIEERVRVDFDIIIALAKLLSEHDEDLRAFQLPVVAEELHRTLLTELDFRREARNLERFRRVFEEDAAVVIPAPIDELSTRRVLTMERMPGISIAEVAQLRKEGQDLRYLALEGARVFLDMVFRDGAFHADPHPGNVLVQPDGRIALIDFGMVGILDDDMRDDLVDLLVSFVQSDPRGIERAVDALATIPSDADRQRLRRDLVEFQSDLAGTPIDELDAAAMLEQFTGILRRHRILLPPPASMLIKVLVMLEGTACGLDRDFSLMQLLQPYCEDILKRRSSPRARARQAFEMTRDWLRLAEQLPGLLDDAARKVSRGEMRVDLVHSGLEATVTLLVSGILCAAMLLGGCILWALKAPPLIFGVPVIGMAATLAALVHGTRILFALRRHR